MRVSDLIKAGLSVIPLKEHKKALLPWKENQTKAYTTDEWRNLAKSRSRHILGVAVVTGTVSGNLECLDFDLKYDLTNGDLMPKFREALDLEDSDLADKIVQISTPSKGFHWVYRVPDHAIPGNHVLLARHPTSAEISAGELGSKPLIETRGEGGYFATDPTEGYTSVHLDLTQLPELTPIEQDILYSVAKSLKVGGSYDATTFKEATAVVPTALAQPTTAVTSSGNTPAYLNPTHPSTVYNEQGDILELLLKHNWTEVGEDEDFVYCRRPGNTTALNSAKIFKDTNKLYVHSSSTEFEVGKPYSPFEVYMVLEAADSFNLAVAKLASAGFGKLPPLKTASSATGTKSFNDLIQPGTELSAHNVNLAEAFIYYLDIITFHNDEWYEWFNRRWNLTTEVAIRQKYFREQFVPAYMEFVHHRDFTLTEELKLLQAESVKQSDSGLTSKYRISAIKRDLAMVDKVEYKLNTHNEVTQILEAVKVNLEYKVNTSNSTLDQTDTIPLENGIYQISTGQFLENEKEYYIFNHLNMAYNITAPDVPKKWIKFLDDIFLKDKELIEFIQISLGYALTNWQDIQKVWFCTGGGANGKSTFMETVAQLWGEDYAIKMNATVLLTKTNQTDNSVSTDLARLEHKRFCTSTEIPADYRINEALVKDLTSGERIVARKMYKDTFSFKPTHKLWLAGNHLPSISGTDDGIWRRMLIIPFNFRIPTQRRRTVEEIIDEFRIESESIFLWLLKGLEKFLKSSKQLKVPKACVEATQMYKNANNTLKLFLEDTLRIDFSQATVHISAYELYHRYKTWCQVNGYNLQGANPSKFSKNLAALEDLANLPGLLGLEFDSDPTSAGDGTRYGVLKFCKFK